MDEQQAPHREMVSAENRYILATVNSKLIACARRSILRARELEIPEKEEAVLDFVMSTAGIDGRAREDLRDALAGARAPTPSLGGPLTNAQRGVPSL
jgi:hypothetical protein